MGFKYTRVRDIQTGHEYDVLSHRVDETKHERVDDERWPESSRIRPPRHNVKGPRPTIDKAAENDGDKPEDAHETDPAQEAASGDDETQGEAQGAEPAPKASTGRTAARNRKSQD